ncbi:ABC transporter ATP-binding protein [Pseudobacteriovorax antillogorgiicola]|uniref:Lipoprotein-releasing system ATP-binding protein n=1 Tax=Pseudobacteriovorax antillogorgiicola TaxID=1513793 RepID=A0A1Y6B9A1_9BACT|nr:ABC transporter ATP-binding protein [Pseudobacteriovorax antillogorgiicola]TCS57580.1 lipoprotein-releasing system ATP-binding protein [Pseudobacteriovorax antillogorgiicola]SME99614.1 lipoprotein-releasing system ATP-binding protein [Pseudobacteriovorax antillogorgiicola]
MSSNHPIIQLNNIHKTYELTKQKVQALRDVSLKIKKGQVVSVTGRSGSGKSTLLHVTGTLDRPTAGQVILDGKDVSTVSDQVASYYRNRTVGFVFQMNNLLPEFSALENVMMPGLVAGGVKQAVAKRARFLLESVELGQRIDHRPAELSGGEQQRVAIARALLMEPPVLLADEPTGNLDKKSAETVEGLLLELCRKNGVTMLLVTHDMELAKRLPDHVIMEDGAIKELGGSW